MFDPQLKQDSDIFKGGAYLSFEPPLCATARTDLSNVRARD